MKNNTALGIALVTLIVGLGIGYWTGNYNTEQGEHMMQNGDMMQGHGSMDMDEAMGAMNAGLKEKTGDAFDAAFLSEMIVHHEGAVEMAQLALTHAQHKEIRDLAGAIISAQNKEIAEMKMWQKNWYQQ